MAKSKVRQACYKSHGFAVVQAITETWTYDQMTDLTTAAGTYTFPANSLPANCLVLGWKAKSIAAFTGNSSATVQVGITGTIGKYSTVTSGSCYTAITVGSGVPEAVVYQAAAATPLVTITGGSDFTNISAGKMKLSIYYIQF